MEKHNIAVTDSCGKHIPRTRGTRNQSDLLFFMQAKAGGGKGGQGVGAIGAQANVQSRNVQKIALLYA